MTAARFSHHVELPSIIKSLFSLLSQSTPDVYLVGSTLHTLMKKQVLNSKQTIDVVVITSAPEQFNVAGFRPCRYNSHLYTARWNEFSINCYVTPTTYRPFIYHNALKRDFCVACLFCNNKGDILDPLRTGLSDFKNKTLQTVNWDPLLQFEKDPIQILRAINYMVLGYDPTWKLKTAIYEWKPTSNLNLPHLYAVARKHLTSDKPIEYVKQLEKYGLLQKMFGLNPGATSQLSYLALAELLGMPEPGRKKNTTTELWTPPQPICIFHPRPYSFSLFPRNIESETKTHPHAKETVRSLEALDLARDYVIGLPHYP